MTIILSALLVLAILACAAAVIYWKKFTVGLHLIVDVLRKGQLPHTRANDTAVVRKLNDAIVTSFNENETQIKDLQRQVAELDIQIKLVGRQKSSIEDIIYSIHDAVIVTDGFDRLSMANEAAAELFGLDIESAKLKQLEEILGERDPKFVEMIQQSRQSKIPHVRREVNITDTQTKDQRTFDCLLSSMFSNDGEVSGVVAVLHDITREKEVSQMKNEFVSHVSHELKTPLASINAYAEMLADGEAEDEDTMKEFCSVIQSQAQRLNRLIEDILNISRIESGLIKVNKENVSLTVLIKDAVEMIKSYAAEKNITVNLKADIVFDQVSADKDMMSQVIVNLLSNAVKYTEPGGEVSIGAEVDESEKTVIVKVTDTGVGIPEDKVDQVFNKFYRVSENDKYAKGTGLGLNLVKQIVENVHDGSVFVKSKVGHGSTFGFKVPLRSNVKAEANA